jgi:hypothetical protein
LAGILNVAPIWANAEGSERDPNLQQGEGFGDVAPGSGGDGASEEGIGGVGGDHDDGDAGCEIAICNLPHESGAIDDGHVDVAQDEVDGLAAGSFCIDCGQALGAVGGLEDFGDVEAGMTERVLDDLPHYGRVIDDQHSHAHAP